MANGARTGALIAGGTAGLAFGPIGAGVGAAVGYGAASIGSLFHKKKKPAPVVPFWKKHALGEIVAGVAVLGVVFYLAVKK